MDNLAGFIVLALLLAFGFYSGHLQNLWKEFNGCITFVIVALIISAIISFFNAEEPTTPTPPPTVDNSSEEFYDPYQNESATAQVELTQWAQEEELLCDGSPEECAQYYDDDCAYGCTFHKAGCDIKGNISQEGIKIYHLPGQEYYSATRINTTYGERWFCTEAEARNNGWRKSKK